MRSTLAVLLMGLMLVPGLTAYAVPSVDLELVATSTEPLFVTHAGDSRLFIVERAGVIRIYKSGQGVLSTPFLDITTLVDTTGQGGLVALAFHPDFGSSSDFFFIAYTEPGLPMDSVVARYAVSSDPDVADPGTRAELLRFSEPQVHHNISDLAFGNDGFLYFSVGDGATNGLGCLAQHDDDFHGKMMRVDVDQNVSAAPYYGIPSSNPFAAPGDGILDEIWAKGLRHVWRFSFDLLTGELWMADVGQTTSEEIILQSATSPGGENYGWKVMEGSFCRDPDPIDPSCPSGTPSCFDSAYTGPIFEYSVVGDCAIIGGYVYRGSAIPDLQGHYIFGDYCSKKIWALEGEEGSFTRTEIGDGSPIHQGPGLTSFGQDADGELYITLGDDVYRLVSATAVPALGPLGIGFLVLSLLSAGVFLRRRI
jgi:glucose/arabinose dehydrogenase